MEVIHVFHHLLQRQLADVGLPDLDSIPDAEKWQKLLHLINDSYHRADDYLLYRALFDQTNDAVLIASLESPPRILTANQRAADMLGYARHEFPGMPVRQVSVPRSEDADNDTTLTNILSGESIRPYEHIFRRKDGSIFPVEVNVQLVKDDEGRPLYVQRVVRDISERKKIEEALRYQATLFNQIQDAVYSTNIHEIILTWNRAAEQMYGWTADEAVGQFSGKVVGSNLSSEDRQKAVQQIKETGKWEGELVHTKRDGTPIPVLVSTSLVTDGAGNPSGFVAISHDITENRRHQEALQQSEERYRQLFAAAQLQAQELALLNEARSAVASEMDIDALIETIIKAFAKIFGYTHLSLYFKEGDKLILQYQMGYEQSIPEFPITKGVMGRVARQGKIAFVTDTANDPDFVEAIGSTRSEICVPLFDGSQVVGVFNIESTGEEDLTQDDLRLMTALSEQLSLAIERARLYTNLRETKEQYQGVLDSIREVVFQTDTDLKWTFLNPAWEEITGYHVEESLGKNFLDFVHPDDRELNSKALVASDHGSNRFWRYQIRYVSKSGATVWFETHARILFGPDDVPLGITGTLTDITERKVNEQQAAELAVQAKIVESLHRFLGNMSHDLRTPLSIMSTSVYLMRRKYGAEIKDTHYLDVMEKQIQHLSRIVDDMVEASRLEDSIVEFEFFAVRVGSLIRDVLHGQNTPIQTKGLTVNLEIEDELPVIQADQVWIGRAVRNVLVNAIEYTPEGGRIDVRVNQQQEQLVIEIADTGIGISEEDLPRIFDRFFRADSARPSDRGGTGLGLTIVQKVVEAHGGRVEVESTVGQGSTFHLWIPIERQESRT